MKELLESSALQLILGKDQAGEEARWEELDNAELDQEVNAYRDSIQALSEELAKRRPSSNPADEGKHGTTRTVPGIQVSQPCIKSPCIASDFL